MYKLFFVRAELEDVQEEYFKVFENEKQLDDFLTEKYKDDAVEKITCSIIEEVDKFQVFVKYKGDLHWFPKKNLRCWRTNYIFMDKTIATLKI